MLHNLERIEGQTKAIFCTPTTTTAPLARRPTALERHRNHTDILQVTSTILPRPLPSTHTPHTELTQPTALKSLH